jgi:cell division septation protein DedD
MPIMNVSLGFHEMHIDSPERTVAVTTRVEQSEPQPVVAQRRIALSFCATVLAGVLLCAAYLARGATRIAARATPKSADVLQAGGVTSSTKPQAILPLAALSPQSATEPAAQVDPNGTKPVGQQPTPAASFPRSGRSMQGGTYLQMAAVDRGVAEVFGEVLRRKGFQVVIANGPTEGIFRVLVGPVKDATSLARVKADLQALGFTSFARKLTNE